MKDKKPAVIVVGSANTDLTTSVEHFPIPGETITGDDLAYNPGGKGNNQATAAKMAGADTYFVARIGRDALAQVLWEHFCKVGMELSQVKKLNDYPTGCALIEVQKNDAQNRIVVIPGANHAVTPEAVREAEKEFSMCSVMLTQLEIPKESVREALLLGRENGMTNILNPAPASPLPEEFFPMIDLFTPNETEAGAYTGLCVENDAEVEEAAERLLKKGVRQVIITLGKRGCYYTNGQESFRQPAFAVDAVDTTGAGDAFNGALAAALARGEKIREAVRFATAYSALSVTRPGAAGSMPSYEETLAFLKDRS